jgi:aspartyl-tRNA(Asn)/glutamyl-tRNA(Gln) amidotransferase subunit A
MPVPDSAAFANLRTLGALLRRRACTCVELAEFFLQRLEKYGPKLNAVVTVTRELALAQAERADRELQQGTDRGPLHGIPYGAKDLLATAGIRTTWGATPYRDQVFDEDATAVVRLRQAGAVLAAKLAMVEIAGGFGYEQANAAFTGPGLNPWDPTRWSGGSSSGCGSAVGGGLVPFAIGSETWGSIMTPASYCGVAGLRPTYGLVSRHGAMALSWSMDKLGPMCRTADDCGLVLAAIAGRDPADASSADQTFTYPNKDQEEPRPPFKLATLADAEEGLQGEVRDNYRAALDVLGKHATVEEIELPNLPYGVVAATFIYAEMGAAFEGLIRTGDVWELTAPEDRYGGHASQFILAKDYINAQRIRPYLQRALDGVLSRFDAVITPTTGAVANPLDVSFEEWHQRFHADNMGGPGNAAGLPSLSVPSGFGEGGLPTGIEFTARAFDEHKLLALGKLYQSATEWHTKFPDLDVTLRPRAPAEKTDKAEKAPD